MDMVDVKVCIFFISGHIDLEEDEFNIHYKPKIDEALLNPQSRFVIGDARGADTMGKNYLTDRIDKTRIIIYTLRNPKKVKGDLSTYQLQGSFRNHEEKDSAMTRSSNVDIAWIRHPTSRYPKETT